VSAEQGQTGTRIEAGRKRVRVYLAGELVADTIRPLLVWEMPYYPTYYFAAQDVLAQLVPTGDTEESPTRGQAEVCDVKVERAVASGAAQRLVESRLDDLLVGSVRFEWSAMDEWLEEDEPVYTHARDPYKRIDILASSRHIRVEVDGVTVAESVRPRLLFETGLPTRYYLPISDVHMDRLRPSSTESHCPYKGTASYWSVAVNGRTFDDLVWIYRTPLPESQKIAGLACFYTEKVDVYVDGVKEEVL
jgi:uncharacterized protein (DUF427 family)